MAKELFVYSPYKSKFKEQVSSGAVDDSQIGIIAESGELWVKGTYLPIVDLSNKADISKGVIEADGLKDVTGTTFLTPNRGIDPANTLATQKYVNEATTNFAKDLTGVIEATPEEFTYRPSAGNRSIRDASAVIRRIKGNSLVWHQYALELSVNNYTIRGDVVTQSDNSLHITSLNSDNKIFIQVLKSIPFRGHKWLSIADVKSDEELTIKGMSSVGWTPNERCLVYSFYTSTNNNAWYWGVSYRTNVPSYVDIYSFSIFDLTLMFGAGNEPTNIEEFYARIPEGVDINAYNVGKIIPMNAIAIETTGFNQWDEQWELGTLTDFGAIAHNSAIISRNFNKILPSTKYYGAYLSDVGSIGNILQIGFWDKNMVYIGRQYATNKAFTTPANAAYFKVATNTSANITTYNNDICINLSHSGVRNGEYEPYKRNIRVLPEIYEYFPDGMNGNANVWDEINAESWIKRWGVVDLGSIDDYTYTGSAFRSSFLKSKMSSVATLGDYNENMICELYDNDRWSNSPYKIQFTVNNGYLWINNPDYTDIDSFKAAMSGVLLYYELAEPIISPITEAIQLDYEVDDFGTEKASSFGNSAPFRADIVYQFNAEGRIRDNSRNIERVESTITTRLIPSQTAMLGLPNKVMTWDGNKTLMSLPIAESIDGWELEEYPYDVLPTGKQVKEYVALNAGPLFPQNQWNDNNLIAVVSNVVTVLTIPEGTTDAIGVFISNNDNNMVLGKDNEWALRFQVPSTGVTLDIAPLSDGKILRWANGEAPTWEAGKIYECSFRLYGDVFLGVWSSFKV
jgi:hypothetical protein